jgi:hypothetical protein
MAKKKSKSAGKLAAQRRRTAEHKLKQLRKDMEICKSHKHQDMLQAQIARREKERV